MAMKSSSLDHWRSYFSSANSDIFEIIQHAIMVAASDSPKEFRQKRDKIAETLFSCKLSRCVGCDRVELANDKEHNDDDGVEVEAGVSKESKVNGSDINDDHRVMNVNHVSIGDAEALTDEIEKESQCVREVLKIKEVLLKHEKECDSVLFESLRRLQLMELNVDRLQATEIGKAVSSLRKHASKEVRQLARTLISDWKEVVDEWIKATTTAAIAASDGTPDSVNPSVVDNDEEGLPSPPMDEGAFFTQAGSIELSQFFDGIDDYGNPRQSGQFNKNHENGQKPSMDSHTIEKGIMQASNATSITNKDSASHQTKKNEAAVRLNKPLTTESGLSKPPKSSMQRKSNADPKIQQKVDNNTLAKRPPIGQQDKFKYSDDAAEEVRLEATKRKLQERYQQVENAKRKRTIQVMELNDLPKQAGVHQNPHFKPGNRNRQWGTQARR